MSNNTNIDSRSVVEEDGMIVFRNILAPGASIMGGTKPLESPVSPPSTVKHSNAKGGLREVADVFEVASIGAASASAFKSRFCK